jgi:hypothetical protein
LLIRTLEDERIQRLVSNWRSVRLQYAEFKGKVKPSDLAGGLEQGLRETPQILQSLDPVVRERAMVALRTAVTRHYPGFVAKEQEWLEGALKRGRIINESEYYLLRHAIDELEGTESNPNRLQRLYKLCGEFERVRKPARTP